MHVRLPVPFTAGKEGGDLRVDGRKFERSAGRTILQRDFNACQTATRGDRQPTSRQVRE